MNNLLLCSSGEETTIWSVSSTITPERHLPIAIHNSRCVDWNQNNNYLFLCSDDGSMYLQSVTKDTCITSSNRVGEEQPIPISCGIILTGSRFVLTGDVCGNIRLWPVSKTGFGNPVMNVSVDNSQITSIMEYSSSLVYACTTKGSILEIDMRKNTCSTLCSLENDYVISMVSSSGTVFFSTASGQVCRFLPLIKRYTPIHTCDSTTANYLSYSTSSLLNAILLYSQNEVKIFNLKTYQVMTVFHSLSAIQSADLYNDTVIVATQPAQLLLLNAYDMTQPITSINLDQPITALRFYRTQSSFSQPASQPTSQPASQPEPEPQPDPIVFSPVQSPLPPRYHPVSPHSSPSEDSVMEAARKALQQSVEEISIRKTDQAVAQLNEEGMQRVVKEVIHPLIIELQTYVHRELSDLKADVVRQFSEQEMVIQRQQEQIEQLVKLLQQRR